MAARLFVGEVGLDREGMISARQHPGVLVSHAQAIAESVKGNRIGIALQCAAEQSERGFEFVFETANVILKGESG